MTVLFNQKEIILPDSPAPSVADALRAAGIEPAAAAGIAVARNNALVRRSEWESALLAEGDRLVAITAVCGG